MVLYRSRRYINTYYVVHEETQKMHRSRAAATPAVGYVKTTRCQYVRKCKCRGCISLPVRHYEDTICLFIYLIYSSSTREFPSATFWTNRGHRCHPAPRPPYAPSFFPVFRAWGPAFPLLADLYQSFPQLALSQFRHTLTCGLPI